MGRESLSFWHLSSSGEQAILAISRLMSDSTLSRNADDYGNKVVTYTTLTEAHVDNSLRRLFVISGALNNEISQRLYSELHDSIYKSWDSRYRWLSQAFDVNISGMKFAQEFKLLTELRNSLVHGGGNLTPMQTARIAQMIGIRNGMYRVLGVQSHGRRLLLNDAVPVRAGKICREYIIGFDGAIRAACPNFDT